MYFYEPTLLPNDKVPYVHGASRNKVGKNRNDKFCYTDIDSNEIKNTFTKTRK